MGRGILAFTAYACLAALTFVGQQAAAGDAAEKPVREAFTGFVEAVKAKDAAQIWKLLDKESQTAADKAAKAVRKAFADASPADKAKLEKALGLGASELANLTGEGFLKTKGFHGKYHEVPGSKIDKVTVQGNRATVFYTEEDGDKEKLRLVQQGGAWKVSAPMPPVPQL